jgi:hypothetical protein
MEGECVLERRGDKRKEGRVCQLERREEGKVRRESV